MDENMENQTPEPDNQPQGQPEQTPQSPPPEYGESAPPVPEQPAPQAETPQSAPIGDLSQDSKNMAMLCHLLGLFTCFIGPLILWLIKKDEDKFVDIQGKEALNFQITVMIGSFIGGLLSAICIGVLVLAAVWICDIVFCILASIATSKGEDYRYPWCLRLVK